MNPAEIATTLLIEKTLGKNSAFRRIDERLYTVKQGSAYVMINVVPWGKDKALVRCVSVLVRGAAMNGTLAQELLTLNAHLRFGAFAWEPEDESVLFLHSILGGATLDSEELMATVRDVALIADEYDDRILKRFGGSRMIDLLEDAAIERLLEKDPGAFKFSEEN
jgi:hypothetical protein